MTVATVSIVESNGAGETVTAITNTNMGSSDTVNMTAASYPITAGTRSYAKYQRFRCTNAGNSSKIKNLKVWRTTALSGSDTHVTNARTSAYGGAASYATPVNTAITGADQTMPTSTPSSANLGIAGSLSGELDITGCTEGNTGTYVYSDYLIHQLVVDSGTTAGTSCTMNYQYDEIA